MSTKVRRTPDQEPILPKEEKDLKKQTLDKLFKKPVRLTPYGVLKHGITIQLANRSAISFEYDYKFIRTGSGKFLLYQNDVVVELERKSDGLTFKEITAKSKRPRPRETSKPKEQQDVEASLAGLQKFMLPGKDPIALMEVQDHITNTDYGKGKPLPKKPKSSKKASAKPSPSRSTSQPMFNDMDDAMFDTDFDSLMSGSSKPPSPEKQDERAKFKEFKALAIQRFKSTRPLIQYLNIEQFAAKIKSYRSIEQMYTFVTQQFNLRTSAYQNEHYNENSRNVENYAQMFFNILQSCRSAENKSDVKNEHKKLVAITEALKENTSLFAPDEMEYLTELQLYVQIVLMRHIEILTSVRSKVSNSLNKIRSGITSFLMAGFGNDPILTDILDFASSKMDKYFERKERDKDATTKSMEMFEDETQKLREQQIEDYYKKLDALESENIGAIKRSFKIGSEGSIDDIMSRIGGVSFASRQESPRATAASPVFNQSESESLKQMREQTAILRDIRGQSEENNEQLNKLNGIADEEARNKATEQIGSLSRNVDIASGLRQPMQDATSKATGSKLFNLSGITGALNGFQTFFNRTSVATSVASGSAMSTGISGAIGGLTTLSVAKVGLFAPLIGIAKFAAVATAGVLALGHAWRILSSTFKADKISKELGILKEQVLAAEMADPFGLGTMAFGENYRKNAGKYLTPILKPAEFAKMIAEKTAYGGVTDEQLAAIRRKEQLDKDLDQAKKELAEFQLNIQRKPGEDYYAYRSRLSKMKSKYEVEGQLSDAEKAVKDNNALIPENYYAVKAKIDSRKSEKKVKRKNEMQIARDALANNTFFSPAIERSGIKNPSPDQIDQWIVKYSSQYGIDPNLARSVMSQESGGKISAVSKKGATGLFQLMPGTAGELGVDMNDPEQNVEGGIRYLSQQIKTFGGSTELGLAAYNAGAGNVRRAGNRIPNFKETQQYVPAIMARYEKLKRLETMSMEQRSQSQQPVVMVNNVSGKGGEQSSGGAASSPLVTRNQDDTLTRLQEQNFMLTPTRPG